MLPDPELERLYDEHAQALFAFLLSMTRNEADTRDILQEVFMRLSKQPGLTNGVRDKRAFLIRMAHNVLIDSFRRRETRDRYHEKLGEEAEDFFTNAVNPDEQVFQKRLAEALLELPEEQRAVVHLKLWEEMTFDAIATALDIPPNTAASRYRYGLDKLRALLRPLYDEIK